MDTLYLLETLQLEEGIQPKSYGQRIKKLMAPYESEFSEKVTQSQLNRLVENHTAIRKISLQGEFLEIRDRIPSFAPLQQLVSLNISDLNFSAAQPIIADMTSLSQLRKLVLRNILFEGGTETLNQLLQLRGTLEVLKLENAQIKDGVTGKN